MTTINEVTAKAQELGFLDFEISNIESKLLPIGTVLKHRKVAGERIASYQVSNDNGMKSVQYVTEGGNTIGITRENQA